MKKYELTNEYIIYLGKKLYRIKALKNFGNVKAGELGGYIENEDNLSQYDNAWVYNKAIVKDNAWVYGEAIVKDNAIVFGDAWIESNADYLNISSLDSYNSYITFAKSRDNTILVHCDWFSGNIEEFEKRVLETIRNNEQAKLYTFAIEMAKTRIKLEYK